uniref:Uncharacterized protein n=1 Tax=Ditylenchus dipsaci TaxID=166011 RepID=A0A915DED2_9BILA
MNQSTQPSGSSLPHRRRAFTVHHDASFSKTRSYSSSDTDNSAELRASDNSQNLMIVMVISVFHISDG